jgi:hypothetical protein
MGHIQETFNEEDMQSTDRNTFYISISCKCLMPRQYFTIVDAVANIQCPLCSYQTEKYSSSTVYTSTRRQMASPYCKAFNTLEENGYAPIHIVISLENRGILRNLALEATSETATPDAPIRLRRMGYLRHPTERRGYRIPLSDIPVNIYKEIVNTDCITFLTRYFEGFEPLIASITVIVGVKPSVPPQEIHEDHPYGPKAAVCIAFDLDPTRHLGTRYVPGSHKSNERADLPLVISNSNACLFDTYVRHGGPEVISAEYILSRFFVTFITSCPQKSEKVYKKFGYQNVSHYPRLKIRDVMSRKE